jgi:hypothetical protein
LPISSVLLPAKRSDEVGFACKTKEEDDETEIRDNIKFQVKIAEGEGLTVKVKYEKQKKAQKIGTQNKTETDETETETQNDTVQDEQGIETQETETNTQYDKVNNEQEIETREAATQEAETETATQYDVKFGRVIEYRKADVANSADAADTGSSDADMAYEWDRDTILQEIPLASWQNFSSVVEQDSLSKFSIATQDNTTTFIFTIARGETDNITANKMKIDFKLTNFPWTADDTYVALLCTVESKKGRKVGLKVIDDSGIEAGPSPPRPTTSRKTKDVKINFADALDTTSVTPFGAFEWADTAEVTDLTTTESTTIEVVATSPASELSNDIAFSFVGSVAHRAADIFWDPTTGVAYESGSGAGALSFVGAASLGFVVLVSMM